MGEHMAALRAGYKSADEHNDAVNRAEREKAMKEHEHAKHPNIGSALAAAQGEFTNPPRNKTVKIPTKTGGSFTFQYADLAGIMDTVRPVLSRHGLAIAQPLGHNGKDEITLKTILLHASGERIEGSEFAVCSDKADAKDIGARITYMRRYALCAMLGIVADDDEDVASPTIDTHKPARNAHHEAPRQATAPDTKKAAKGRYRCPPELDGTDLAGLVMTLDSGDPHREVVIGLKGGRKVKAAASLDAADEAQFFDVLRYRWEAKDKPLSDAKKEEQRTRFYDKNRAEMLADLAAVLEARAEREKLEADADGYATRLPGGADAEVG